MIKLTKKFLKPSVFFLAIVALLVSFSVAQAISTGTVDSADKTARFFDDTANLINFKPSYLDNSQSVAMKFVGNEITGYGWGNTVGWVNLNSTNCDSDGNNFTDQGNFSFCSVGDPISTFEVAYDGTTLSGYAFSQNGGWINFGPFTNSSTPEVTIDPVTGELDGFAWTENYGWLQFDCAETDACVKINFTNVGGGGGGQVNGSCGSSSGGTFSTVPASDLCNAGNATTISGDGSTGNPWTWQCLGTNGGFDSSACTANFSVVAPPSCTAPLIYDPISDSCVDFCDLPENASTQQCTLLPPDDGEICVPPSVLDPITNTCTVVTPFCSLPQNVNLPECNPIGPPVLDCSLPENATLPQCSLLPPDEGCTGPDCEVVPTCTGPDCVITPGGGCVGSDCGVTPGGGGVTPEEIIGDITEIVNNPTVSAVTQVVTTAGLVLGASIAITSALFVSPLAAPELVMIPFRLWTLLLSFLGIRKQAKKWGLVYDSVTMQPLDPAYVVLKDAAGNETGTSLTDIDGRYGFPVEPGTYTLYANKTDYQFPSAKLAGHDHDTLHKDLYFGENIVVRESGEIITKNIPMDRLNFNWNEWAKNQKSLMKFYSKRSKLIAEISSFFFGVGFTVSTVALIFAPKGYNIGIFLLYVLLFILRHTNILKAKKTGSISDSQGNPLSFAIIRVFSAAIPDVEITHRVADKFGRFYALVPNGNYIVKIDEKTGEETYNTVFTSAPTNVTKGLIDNDFKINR